MKGVSQVLTSTIILAVAVSVAAVYSNWAPSFAGELAGNAGENIDQDIKCSNAGLTIETVEYDLSGNFTEVELRNSGTINLKKGIEVVVFSNKSEILGQAVMERIPAGETRRVRIDNDRVPSRMAASSRDCPGKVVVSTDTVSVKE